MRRADAYRAARARPALVVCALDTELLGHWWYEGPVWLEAVIAEADRARARARDAPGSARAPRAAQRATLLESTWGTGKDLHTWDSPPVADVVWAAREAELAARRGARLAGPLDGRAPAARRAARELLALQSSDWAFMASRGLAADYRARAGPQPLASRFARRSLRSAPP